MAIYKFGVTGQDRKRLVEAISEILDTEVQYLGAPTFAYTVGDYHIDKEGTVTGNFDLNLFAALEQNDFEPEPSETFHLITPRGIFLINDHFATAEEAVTAGYGNYFHHEGWDVYIKTNPNGSTEHSKLFAVVGAPFPLEAPAEEPLIQDVPQDETPDMAPTAAEETDLVRIDFPLDGFSPEAIDNLTKMVLAKEALIKKALGTKELPIKVLEDRISFPWFAETDSDSITAYAQFVGALCNTAKEKKRVTAKAQESYENERFAMRVWLIGLGMIGEGFKLARKLLMANLSGNSAWRHGKPEGKEDPAE